MGVSAPQFWDMNPRLLSPFARADQLRLERQNMVAWLTGAYVRSAVASCLSNRVRYPEKPERITPMSKREKAAFAEAEREKALTFFRQLEADFRRKEAMKRGGGAD